MSPTSKWRSDTTLRKRQQIASSCYNHLHYLSSDVQMELMANQLAKKTTKGYYYICSVSPHGYGIANTALASYPGLASFPAWEPRPLLPKSNGLVSPVCACTQFLNLLRIPDTIVWQLPSYPGPSHPIHVAYWVYNGCSRWRLGSSGLYAF